MPLPLLLLVGLALAVEPEKQTLPVRMLSLSTDPAHVRIDDNRLFISGFHTGKVVALNSNGKEQPRVLPLDFFEFYRNGENGQEIREIRRATGGDLVLAGGKIFVGQVFAESLLVIDQETFKPIKRLAVGGEGSMTATRDGKTVFFASNKKDEFHIIDSKTYQHHTVMYPEGGRGIGCIALSPDEKRLILGIQRGGKMSDGKQLSGGNCFLAVYDLVAKKYVGTVFLAQKLPDGSGDDAWPTSLAFTPDGKRLYVGTFQSRAGVLEVDPIKMELLHNIYMPSKYQNPGLPWTDPLSVAVFDRWLLAAVRSNQEVVAIDLASHKVVAKMNPQTAAVDLERVMVHEKQIYLFGGSSAMSIADGAELAKILQGIKPEKTGPARITLIKK